MPFRALGLDPKILQAVQEAGYTEPTPIQVAVIPQILAGHDVIGIAQTGTGKTAAFALPLLTKLVAQPPGPRRGTRVLVVAPTRELALQIDENFRIYARNMPLTVATVFGGVGEQPQIRALRAGTDVVIACPGRLLDLMDRRNGDFSGLQYLVLAETVTQLVYEVPKHLKSGLLLHLLRDPQMDMVLVFSRMKHGADRIARHLEQKGIRTATLHSNRSQNQRIKALKDFKSGVVRVLVATDIAARGIDVDGISHVVNYDFPMHAEDYVHRIGRTGRAHAVGDAISFVTPEDHGELRMLERFIGRGIVRKRAEGFNYAAAGPAQSESGEDRQQQQQQRPHGHSQSGKPARQGGGSQHGRRQFRRW